MARIIKIRCNGSGEHINEVDLDKVLAKQEVVKGLSSSTPPDIPERLVLPCKSCTEGRVVMTRRMVEEVLRRSGPG